PAAGAEQLPRRRRLHLAGGAGRQRMAASAGHQSARAAGDSGFRLRHRLSGDGALAAPLPAAARGRSRVIRHLQATFCPEKDLFSACSSFMEATMSRGVNSWVHWSWVRWFSVGCLILMTACASGKAPPPQPMPLQAYHVDFATDSYAIDAAGKQAIAA